MSREKMNEDIVTALGLPIGKVTAANIILEAGCQPMVEVSMELDGATSERLTDLLQTYRLVEGEGFDQLE